SLKKELTARGFSVKDVPWDLTAEGMKSDGSALLLGGEIKTLWLESTSDTLKTHLRATVQIRVVAGDPLEKKIVRSVDVSSRLEQDLLYSREELEDALSEALTSAIDQIFRDEDLKKRLQ
ncbi:MAG: YajG family lipoprotein, partial [Nitrospirota bacterium]